MATIQPPAFQLADRLRARRALAVVLGSCLATAACPQPPDPTPTSRLTLSPLTVVVAPPPGPGREKIPGRFYRDGELTAVASESGVVVKFGDPKNSHGPRVFDVFWFDGEDGELGAVTGVYGPRGRLRVTDDGSAAWTAPRLGSSGDQRVALYGADGARRWEHRLPEQRRTEDLAVDPDGKTVAVVMSEFRLKRDRDEVLIFNESGLAESLEGLGLVKLVLFPEGGIGGGEIFVVGTRGYLLFELAGGLRWKVTGNLWPAEARLAATSPDRKVFFFVEGPGGGSQRNRLTGLELSTGRVLASLDLPEATPSGRLEVDQEKVRIRLGETQVETRWTYED